MNKLIDILLSIALGWAIYYAIILPTQEDKVKNLNAIIEEQYETIARQKWEINQAWKRGNFWIFEANRRRERK